MCHSLTGTPCKVPTVHAQGKPAMSRRKHSCVSRTASSTARGGGTQHVTTGVQDIRSAAATGAP